MRPDPAQRGRLEQIRASLADRITEARREGWTGEAEGLKISLQAAGSKLVQMQEIAARRALIDLGMPARGPAVSRTVTTAATLAGDDQ